MREAEVVGDSSKIPSDLLSVDVNILEEQNFPSEAHDQVAQAPMTIADIALFNQDPAAFVEVTENAPAKTHISLQRAFDACETFLVWINQDGASHTGEQLFHASWGIIFRIGAKLQSNKLLSWAPQARCTRFEAGVFPQKCIGRGSQDV